MASVTAEQLARDMLERMGVEDAQSWSNGEVVELAKLIANRKLNEPGKTAYLDVWRLQAEIGNAIDRFEAKHPDVSIATIEVGRAAHVSLTFNLHGRSGRVIERDKRRIDT